MGNPGEPPSPFDSSDARDVACYDELPLWSSLAGALLLDEVPLAGVRTVLDVGCGTGFPLLELAERLGPPAFAVGLDPWHQALVRVRLKRGRWGVASAAAARGDGARAPFRDGAFDLIVSNLGVNNFADPTAAFGECRRLLRPGGVLALSTNLVGHMRELYSAFRRVLERARDAAALERLERHVAHRATVESLTERLGDAGLRVARVARREATMRFASAAALFEHHFIRQGFRGPWEEVAGGSLAALGRELDGEVGDLRLTIPLAYVEAVRD